MLRRLLVRSAPLLIAMVLVLAAGSLTWACPGCKDALIANDPERARLAKGFGWSIIFMFSTPYIVFATVSGYFYLEVRRARRDKAILAERKAREAAEQAAAQQETQENAVADSTADESEMVAAGERGE